ncbi:hypothetical protein M569_03853 [Genlisea aurea]|uniref:Disease resistance protein winged helix domain-containing protein n=1 Tax=Genlisea aurea TaxID=192259 RepID=S8CVR9_9LAMI|nr:hypothetical protein M569_03853 [Genlisea aurea]
MCGGLPLAVVVIAGFLKQVEKTKRAWEEVANTNNMVKDSEFKEVFSLVYHHLPHHLKPCLLYFGAFPDDKEISVSKVVKLWVAEGFLKQIPNKTHEEVAVECIEELVSWNLIFVGRRRVDGSIKTFIIHDLLKEVCSIFAKEEHFLVSINASSMPTTQQVDVVRPRRLALHGSFTSDTLQCFIPREELSLVRSLLQPSFDEASEAEGFPCELIRVLDLSRASAYRFSLDVKSAPHLRYLYFAPLPIVLPPFLPDCLWNLHTLIVPASVTGSQVLWRMKQLRHLQFLKCDMASTDDESHVLENLHTLLYLRGSSCAPDFFAKTPNLKKLGIRVELADDHKQHEQISEPEIVEVVEDQEPFLNTDVALDDYKHDLFSKHDQISELEATEEELGEAAADNDEESLAKHEPDYAKTGDEDEYEPFSLGNLENLLNLETLNCIVEPPLMVFIPENCILPQNLKKVTLNNTRIPWESISIVGKLPELRTMKLMNNAFRGENWIANENEFKKLQHLVIDGADLKFWTAEKDHFPRLEHLTILDCIHLDGIPPQIPLIDTIKMIEVDDASSSALISAGEIKKEMQENIENGEFQLTVLSIWDPVKKNQEEWKKKKKENGRFRYVKMADNTIENQALAGMLSRYQSILKPPPSRIELNTNDSFHDRMKVIGVAMAERYGQRNVSGEFINNMVQTAATFNLLLANRSAKKQSGGETQGTGTGTGGMKYTMFLP